MKDEKFTNSLINESSPYLLQHAHNPVNWLPWNNEALKKAKNENKLIVVSIGYSACHWCHVMEHESFEDEKVARIMNENFISIKVDREERPDIDQVYMSAVQIMTGHGGWPLNCITLPDGRPLYGGTYFPKKDWINVLTNLAEIWKNNNDKANQYAEELTQGIRHVEKIKLNEQIKKTGVDVLFGAVEKWMKDFDYERGGPNRAPKFPMPNNWQFLLRYSRLSKNIKAEIFFNTTLMSMASGGIYDHVGGGFARYSTDMNWKIPHFEKMLYDNAQLISLYAEAYRANKNPLYKEVAEETIQFIERELTCGGDSFLSALDADSEGEEGKYYIWEREEIECLLSKSDFELFSDVFSINENGYWEDAKYILLIAEPISIIASKHNIKVDELKIKIKEWKKLLLDVRGKRLRPGVDDKMLASWNAMMIRAYCEAYSSFGNKIYKEKAVTALKYFINSFQNVDAGLYHARKENHAYINGFLEDYAFAIDAAMAVFLIDARQEWLDFSISLTNYCFDKFYDDYSGMFFFTSSDDEDLIVRKAEISDNVIPSSNSVMARNLNTLYRITGNSFYRKCSEKMLNNVVDELVHYVSGYSNWGILFLELYCSPSEVVICGEGSEKKFIQHMDFYYPNTLSCYSTSDSSVPIFKGRWDKEKTLIYVCKNQTCSNPVEEVESVNQLIM